MPINKYSKRSEWWQKSSIVCDRGQLWEVVFSKPPTIISSFPCGAIIRLSGQRIPQSYVYPEIKTIHMGALETALTSVNRWTCGNELTNSSLSSLLFSFGAFWRKITPVRLVHTTRRTQSERSGVSVNKYWGKNQKHATHFSEAVFQTSGKKRLRFSGSRGIHSFGFHTTMCLTPFIPFGFSIFRMKTQKPGFSSKSKRTKQTLSTTEKRDTLHLIRFCIIL